MAVETIYDVDGGWVIHGDCVDGMKTLADDSVDSVVTDPPYGIAILGREWDSFSTTEAFERWTERWAREALRVLKPGGHAVVFCGDRMYHRMACGVEDAGFEVRHLIAWTRCLSEDTEVLTEGGWKRGAEVQVGDLVAAWNSTTDEIRLEPVLDVYRAPYRGPMVAFRNRDTDQLLTPNHRVYRKIVRRPQGAGVRRSNVPDSEWAAECAGEVRRGQAILLPLASYHDGPGIGGEDYAALLAWVWTEGSFDKGGNAGLGVRIYQTSSKWHYPVVIDSLLSRLAPNYKRYTRVRRRQDLSHLTGKPYPRTGEEYVEHTWFFSGPFARRVRRDLPNKRPSWVLLWRMTIKEKYAFFLAAVRGDGTIRKQPHTFYQKSREDREWFQALLCTIGYHGKLREPMYMPLRLKSTTQLLFYQLKEHASVDYDGLVWCVRVPSGAFVARRNGLVFITGNSGFPTVAHVAKPINKKLGGEPTVPG